MAILLAGCTLLAGILGQCIIFDYSVQEIVTSIEVRRSLNRNPVRKGTILQVTSTISFKGSSRMHVEIIDQLPPKTILVDGVTSVSTKPDASPQTHRFNYRLIPLVHGSQAFSGISVTLMNRFFTSTILLTRKRDREPVLSVLPKGLFATQVSDLSEGSRDNRKASVLSGTDIHSLREYHIGDDLRHVDWKISAKYTKLMIRKHTGLMSHPPLVIIDLPWRGAPYPEKEFSQMISEVIGMVKHSIETYQYVSVLLITGPNILHLIREEKNLSRCISEIREWMHPAERLVHFYHMPDRSDLRLHVRSIENDIHPTADPKILTFFELLRNRYLGVLQYQKAPAFSGQVARAITQIQLTEAYLFSLGCGDTSHIRHVIRPLKAQKIRVHLRIISSMRAGTSEMWDHSADTQREHS
jgi:hypothetical protein